MVRHSQNLIVWLGVPREFCEPQWLRAVLSIWVLVICTAGSFSSSHWNQRPLIPRKPNSSHCVDCDCPLSRQIMRNDIAWCFLERCRETSVHPRDNNDSPRHYRNWSQAVEAWSLRKLHQEPGEGLLTGARVTQKGFTLLGEKFHSSRCDDSQSCVTGVSPLMDFPGCIYHPPPQDYIEFGGRGQMGIRGGISGEGLEICPPCFYQEMSLALSSLPWT